MDSSNLAHLRRVAAASVVMLIIGCSEGGKEPDGFAAPHAPTGFAPSSETVRSNERIARCNTVHSLTLPTSIVERYGVQANEDTAVISCSLQEDTGGPPRNIAAQVSGTVTTLTGQASPIDFKEILDDGAVSYLGTFSIKARSALDFEISLTDPSTGKTYPVGLKQSELPGRQ